MRLAKVVGLPLDFLADDAADTVPIREAEDPDWLTLRRMAIAIGPGEAIRRLLQPPLEFSLPPGSQSHRTGAREQPHDSGERNRRSG